jgi:DNA-binding XRE family transcriptional regulator
MEVGGFKTIDEYSAWFREPLDDWEEPDWAESAFREMGCFDEDEDDDPAILEYMTSYEDAYLQEKEDQLIQEHSGDVFIRVGKRVRELRKAKGWNQHDLALHIGLGRTCVSNVERGSKNSSLRSLEIFAIGFGMTLSQFLAGI